MNEVNSDHPRAESLRIRKKLSEGFRKGLVTPEGLAAHGRGEAFDYILGERTTKEAEKAIEAAAAEIIKAKNPVFSVNGNVSALVCESIAELSERYDIDVEVNLFHESEDREKKIAEHLKDCGVDRVLGVEEEYSTEFSDIKSSRKKVDKRGQKRGDVIVVPLEDGDRTEALVKSGKTVITVDLNPMSRTARAAHITIVDNIVRAMPILIEKIGEIKNAPPERIEQIIENFDNEENLRRTIESMLNRLKKI
ncbi:hypothetical protein AKJ62_00165 [candidate division MSBL1 archaeon SCGC-AAA259D14]|uniref:4-phosphopantoate--beta-alanine ligase n=2 Tax=candidate division MSBL1 TaxID=215777 RepID=A0A133U985_9EURY|nr:hypothetical protein AKJ62_00165 [candidate division MSBL1 archaeon SCGC-AAA259D14]KXA94835.1 hypothetical protein AKJ36_02115 [candidate division MSBL1 archaeon SCGC-AAA259I07]